jgi:glycosyltransferase involved in cell wall biosynthesis
MSTRTVVDQEAGVSERADVALVDLVHVLAQLPGTVMLEVGATGPELAALRPLVRAYGVQRRVRLIERGHGPPAWRFEGAAGEPGRSSTMAETIERLWPEDAVWGPAPAEERLLDGQRVAIVANLPAHYRIPLFTKLGAALAEEGADMRVFFLGASAPGRPWLTSGDEPAFDHEFLHSLRIPARRARPPLLPLNLSKRLGAFDATILLVAGLSPFCGVEAAGYARRRRIPLGIWSGEIASFAARRKLRGAFRRWLARQADFGIAYGTLAERYLHMLGPELPVVIGRNTSVDGTAELGPDAAGDVPELLAVADLNAPGKDVGVLEQALALKPDLSCRLTVIGGWPRPGGPVDAARRDARIRFLGPRPKQDVLEAFRRSDIFLMPSRGDIFGLALVEAMAAGLAVVTTRAAGATADLAVPGRNCVLAEPQSPEAWAEAIEALVTDAAFRQALGRRASRTISRRWTFGHATEAMLAGVRLGAIVGRQQ